MRLYLICEMTTGRHDKETFNFCTQHFPRVFGLSFSFPSKNSKCIYLYITQNACYVKESILIVLGILCLFIHVFPILLVNYSNQDILQITNTSHTMLGSTVKVLKLKGLSACRTENTWFGFAANSCPLWHIS